MMKKRMVLRLLALLLAGVLCMPVLVQSVQALTTKQIEAMDDIPVFGMQFENEDSYVQSSAFLMEDSWGTGYTYLVTTDTSTYMLDQGYTATLYGPDYCEEATYITSEGNFAFYYAPGMSAYEPLKTAYDYKDDLIVVTPKVSGGQITGVNAKLMDPSGWSTKFDGLLISGNKASSSLQFGAPVFCESYGGVIGCGVSANSGCFAVSYLFDTDFPTYASIDYIEDVLGLNSGSSSANSSSGQVSGSWSDTRFTRNGRYTYPFELDSPLKRCTGFTLNYEISDVTSGSMSGNYKFAVYVRTTSGDWKYAAEFNMTGYDMTKQIRFSEPLNVDAVAVVCLKNGNYSYSCNMSITDPILR